MEINKQLFENILAGKLKGTFVLRNKQIVKSDTLKRSSNDNFPYIMLIKYDNGITAYGTFKSNGDFETYTKSYYDIVNFIPDTDKTEIDSEMYSYNKKDVQFVEHFINAYHMKENELTIEIPDGKIVDWDESKKQNKIVLKDKQLTYEDVCKKLFENEYFFIDAGGCINHSIAGISYYCANNAQSEHQLECILAKNKLANVAKYLNDGWKPVYNDEEIWVILSFISGIHPVKVMQNSMVSCSGTILFKSEELARQAIEILGEETVKLALEPLGI